MQMGADYAATRIIDLLHGTITVRVENDGIIHHVNRSDSIFVKDSLNPSERADRIHRSILRGEAKRPIKLLLRIDYDDEFGLLCRINSAKIFPMRTQHEVKRGLPLLEPVLRPATHHY